MSKKKTTLKCSGVCPADGVLRAQIEPPMQGLPAKIAFNNRHTQKIKTGLSVEVPEGYKLCIGLVQNLAEKGMVLTNSPGNFTNGPVEAIIVNAGREIVDVNNGDPIVNFWIEEVENYVWECCQ